MPILPDRQTRDRLQELGFKRTAAEVTRSGLDQDVQLRDPALKRQAAQESQFNESELEVVGSGADRSVQPTTTALRQRAAQQAGDQFQPADFEVTTENGQRAVKTKSSALRRVAAQQAGDQFQPADFKIVTENGQRAAELTESAREEAAIQSFLSQNPDFSRDQIDVVRENGDLKVVGKRQVTRQTGTTRTVTRTKEPTDQEVRDAVLSNLPSNQRDDFSGSDVSIEDTGDGKAGQISFSARRREGIETALASVAAPDKSIEQIRSLPESEQQRLADQAPVDADALNITTTTENGQTVIENIEISDQAQLRLAERRALDDIEGADELSDVRAQFVETEDGEQIEVIPNQRQIRFDREVELAQDIPGANAADIRVAEGQLGNEIVFAEDRDSAEEILTAALRRDLRRETETNIVQAPGPGGVIIDQRPIKDVSVDRLIDEHGDELTQLISGESTFRDTEFGIEPDTRDLLEDIADDLDNQFIDDANDISRDQLTETREALATVARFETSEQKTDFVFGTRDPSQTRVIDPDFAPGDPAGFSVPVDQVERGEQRFEQQIETAREIEETETEIVESEQGTERFATTEADVETTVTAPGVVEGRVTEEAITSGLQSEVAAETGLQERQIEVDETESGQFVAFPEEEAQLPSSTPLGNTALTRRERSQRRRAELAAEETRERALSVNANVGLAREIDAAENRIQSAQARAQQIAGNRTQARRERASTVVGEGVNVAIGGVVAGGAGTVRDRPAATQPRPTEEFGDFAVPFPERSVTGRRTQLGGQRVEDVLRGGVADFRRNVIGPAAGVAESAGERLGAFTGERFAGTESVPAARVTDLDAEERAQSAAQTTGQFLSGVTSGVGEIAATPATAPLFAKETAEFLIEGGEETAAGRGGNLVGEVSAETTGSVAPATRDTDVDVPLLEGGFAGRAEQAGVEAVGETVEAARQNPVEFTGQAVGSALVSTGAIATAGRVSPAAGRSVSTVIQPGEEAAIAAARRGVISSEAASLVPGVSRRQAETDADARTSRLTERIDRERRRVRQFFGEERAQADLIPGSRGRSRSQTRDVSDALEQMEQRQRGASRRLRRERERRQERRQERRRESFEREVDAPDQRLRTEFEGFDSRLRGIQQAEVATDTSTITEPITAPTSRLESAQQAEVAETATEPTVRSEITTTPALTSETATGVGPAVETAFESRLDTTPAVGFEVTPELGVSEDQRVGVGVRTEPGLESRSEIDQGLRTEPGVETRVDTRTEQGIEARTEALLEIGTEPRVEFGVESRTESRSELAGPETEETERRPLDADRDLGPVGGDRDPALGTGFLSETIATAARLGQGAQTTATEEELAERPFEQALIGERAPAAFTSGPEPVRERVAGLQNLLFTPGGGEVETTTDNGADTPETEFDLDVSLGVGGGR